MINTDVVIIGAGTAGYNAFREARKHTSKVLLINKGYWGTTCANVGCMPSKLLIGASHNQDKFKEKNDILSFVNKYRKKWSGGLHDRATLPSDNEYYQNSISGEAKFIDTNSLKVNGEIVNFKSAVISTGSSPFVPDNLKFDNTLTTDTIFDLKSLPKSLAIVGAGVIALELGQAMQDLGVKVTFFTRDGNVGRFSDPVVGDEAKRIFNNKLDIKVEPNMTANTFADYEYVLVAAGRKPNKVQGLDIENRGRLFAATNYNNVFMAGDINGELTLQHEAADEGRAAGKNAGLRAMGEPIVAHTYRAPLAIVFTNPQIMSVGKPFNKEYQVGQIDWSDQGRALTQFKNEGITRLYAKDGYLVGAEGIGPDQEHHAHLLAWCIQMNMTIKQMLQMPFYHPVTLEGIRTALKDIK